VKWAFIELKEAVDRVVQTQREVERTQKIKVHAEKHAEKEKTHKKTKSTSQAPKEET